MNIIKGRPAWPHHLRLDRRRWAHGQFADNWCKQPEHGHRHRRVTLATRSREFHSLWRRSGGKLLIGPSETTFLVKKLALLSLQGRSVV